MPACLTDSATMTICAILRPEVWSRIALTDVYKRQLLFRGRYRVTEYRAVAVQWFDSRAEVMAWAAWRRRMAPP